jgi:hypothetical protein
MMDRNDQRAIEDLFERLEEVERRGPARDRDAEDFVERQIRRQPGAPYYMAQTIIMQQKALERLQARLAEQEGEEEEGGLFGGRRRRPSLQDEATSVPRTGRGGGGFLAGAAQTAIGVAGGVLLGNALAGLFGGTAEAAENGVEDIDDFDDGDPEDDGPDDDGGFGGFDGGDLDV